MKYYIYLKIVEGETDLKNKWLTSELYCLIVNYRIWVLLDLHIPSAIEEKEHIV